MKKSAKSRLRTTVESLNGLKFLGEVVTWSTGRGTHHKHSAVTAALSSVSLDPDIAREILPRQAFTRASRILSDERLIEVLRDETDSITFQFTTKATKKEEIVYSKETLLKLNKTTGKVSCPIKALQEKAQDEVDRCLENRTASDITNIVQKLFANNADLFPIRDQGGAYFVPQTHNVFTDQVAGFLTALGGNMRRFPIPEGTQHGDQSVQDAVASGLEAMVQEYEDSIQAFGLDTRQSTLESAADKIKATKVKVEAYASYLSDRQQELIEALDKADKKLVKRISEISKDRTDKTKVKEKVTGHPGITDVIYSLLMKAGESNPITKEEIMDILTTKFPGRETLALRRTVNGQIGYNLKVNKGIIIGKIGEGYYIDQKATKKNQKEMEGE